MTTWTGCINLATKMAKINRLDLKNKRLNAFDARLAHNMAYSRSGFAGVCKAIVELHYGLTESQSNILYGCNICQKGTTLKTNKTYHKGKTLRIPAGQ